MTPLGGDGSGLTGIQDWAYHIESPQDGNGPFCRTDGDVQALDGLQSVTLTGWFHTSEAIGGNVEHFKTNKFKQ
jgi:hypothetical protein